MRENKVKSTITTEYDADLTIFASFCDEAVADGALIDNSDLQAHNCHDADELHKMRPQPGYNFTTCRVDAANDNACLIGEVGQLKADLTGDMREQAREDRDGESQAPPAQSRDISEEGIKAMSNKAIIGKIKTAHSKAVYESMCELAGRGFFVHPAHCVQNDGYCSSQYVAVKRAKELRAKGLPFEMPAPIKGGKMPKGQGWQKEASNDPRMVELWFEQYANQMGNTNVSIVTGSRTGVLVIDLDGEIGIAAFAELEKKLGVVPVTVESNTGGGGKHLLFRWSGADLRNSAKVLGDNIDVRGENGQIIAPPSLHHSGKLYQWADGRSPADVGLADLPPAWIEAIQGSSKITAKIASRQLGNAAAKVVNNHEGVLGSTLEMSAIGEPEKGGTGFNDPINAILIAFFAGADGRHQANADQVRQAISDHVESLILLGETGEHRRRYTIAGGYLDDQIASARKYIENNPSSVSSSRSIGTARLPYGFAVGEGANEGFIGYFKEADGKNKRFVPVCSTFDVLGRARTEDGDGWGLVMQFADGDGAAKEIFVSRADLLADSKVVRRALSDAGMTIKPREASEFDKLLGDLESNARILLARSPGWQKDGTFITPGGLLLGGNDDQRIILDNAKMDTASGTLEGAIAVMNAAVDTGVDHFAIAPMAGVAGCLLDFCDLPSVVVAYTGTTSRGKTTSLELSVSMWTKPNGGSNSLLTSMRSTSNGLESFLVGANGTVAAIDEMQLCEGRELNTLVFMVASGEAKARAMQDGRGRKKSYWTTCAILSGEIGVAEKISQAGAVVAGGLTARVVEIDVSDTKTLDTAILNKLAARRKHFGQIGPAFAAHLAKRYTPRTLQDRIAETSEALAGSAVDPLSKRIAGAYAVLQVAGMLLQEAELLNRDFDMSGFFDGLSFRHLTEIIDPVENAVHMLQAKVMSTKDVTIKVFGDEGYREADGWYDKDDCEFVCIRADKIQELSGGAVKPLALVKRLDRDGYLLRQGKNLAWESLPSGGLSVGGKVKNYRIRRECFWGASDR